MLRRLGEQRGFTTITLMSVLLVGGLLVTATFTAVQPDIGFTRQDQDSKQAYAAAESGLNWYMNSLARDNTYYLKCDNPPAPSATEVAPVNAPLRNNSNGTSTYPNGIKWRFVPGETSKYTVDLVPAAGKTLCSTTDQYTMIDPEGNIQLRITGRSRARTRTILATLRRQNFLDYIYFTHFETLDPAAYSDPATAEANCAFFRAQRASWCQEIQFDDDDDVLGPFHTNDNIRVCGTTQFGENTADRIEINGSPAWVNGGCTANPDIQGTLVNPSVELRMPPNNQELQNIAAAAYRYTGKTKITLKGSVMDVTTYPGGVASTAQNVALPPNGVIYVNSSATCSGYDLDPDYNEAYTCGNVYVHGNYGGNLTIGAANDIIVDGDLTRDTDDLLLGLVAYNFVRVYHPCGWGGNGAGSITDLTIEAAILAINHSFIVDNWDCGAGLGRLNVDGAIAQYFRGPVGTSGGNGYLKNYTYNRRLKYREPPYFLDPQQASWRVVRQSEMAPPCTATNTTCPVP
jgi:type II secretory pathway pseudopilin PulG